MPTLKNWAIVMVGGPYDAPETHTCAFSGRVYGRDGFEDGSRIVTSRPTSVDMESEPRTVTTKSGTIYKLDGPPAAEWVAFLFSNGYSVQQYVDQIARRNV